MEKVVANFKQKKYFVVVDRVVTFAKIENRGPPGMGSGSKLYSPFMTMYFNTSITNIQ